MLSLARFALSLLAVSVAASSCTTARPSVVDHEITVPSRHVLDNGVRILIEERRSADVVALHLWVGAGGRDESASELGLAHYLEHMLFKGTVTRPAGFIERDVEAVGGRMNAGTSLDYTYYHVLLPASRVVQGIETLADISVNASLDETQLEREKKVVLEEMRLAEDNPNRSLGRKLYEAVFERHPYGRPVIGTSEIIRGLTREQLVSFYRHHYVPEAFTLVVVGAVRTREVLEAATRAFGRLPRAGIQRLPAPPMSPDSTRTITMSRAGAHAYLALAWPAPRLDHADGPALDLLTSLLGQGRSARLTQTLRERLGLVNVVTAGYSALEAGGMVSVTAQLEPQHLARVESEIVREIRRLREEGLTEDERQRVVTTAEARQEAQLETAEGRAFMLGHAETNWHVEDALAYLDRLRSVTPKQARAAARRYLDPEHYARVVLAPGPTR
jgi:zinc protease